jgi:hypothetical protein
MGKSIVSIVKGTDLDEMVEEVVSLLGGINTLIKPIKSIKKGVNNNDKS